MDYTSEEEDGEMRCWHQAGPKERYEELEMLPSLNRRLRYAAACKELAFILRNAYSKSPKILQSLIFQDTLSAFRLLPELVLLPLPFFSSVVRLVIDMNLTDQNLVMRAELKAYLLPNLVGVDEIDPMH